jgi:hypothetical protein
MGTYNNIINSVPVVGHLKGAVHLALGDAEGGKQALKSSTRTVSKLEFINLQSVN